MEFSFQPSNFNYNYYYYFCWRSATLLLPKINWKEITFRFSVCMWFLSVFPILSTIFHNNSKNSNLKNLTYNIRISTDCYAHKWILVSNFPSYVCNFNFLQISKVIKWSAISSDRFRIFHSIMHVSRILYLYYT